MAAPRVLVAAPARRPRKGGISSVVGDFRNNPRLAAAEGLQYDPDTCTLVVNEVQLCYGPDVDAADKTGVGIPEGTSVIPNFGGYVGVECWLNGSPDEYGPMATRALEAGQDRLVEAMLWPWITGGPSVAATDLSDAIGKADQFADQVYAGEPILHMNRFDVVTAKAAGALISDDSGDGRLWTPNGTPVVSSSAYTIGIVGVTGSIAVEQSPIGVYPGRDLTHNTMLAIAERVFGIVVDCDFRGEFTVTP